MNSYTSSVIHERVQRAKWSVGSFGGNIPG